MSPIRKLINFVLLLVFLSACAGLGSFSFTEESETITVRGQPSLTSNLPLADLFPTSIPLEVNLEQELAEQDASGARSVHLTELYFELTDESSQPDFDFLDRITLTVEPRDADSDLPARQLAIRNPIPDGQQQFYLDVNDELNLKSYVEAGLRLRTNVSGSPPSSDATFKVFATFRVRVL